MKLPKSALLAASFSLNLLFLVHFFLSKNEPHSQSAGAGAGAGAGAIWRFKEHIVPLKTAPAPILRDNPKIVENSKGNSNEKVPDPTGYVVGDPFRNLSTLDDFSTLMATRRSLIDRRCRGLQQRFDPSRLFVLQEKAIGFCPVFKASTTNWMLNFFELSSLNKKEKRKLTDSGQMPLDLAKSVSKHPSLSQLQNAAAYKDLKTFLIVRHPFHRLVSAYRDKLERLHGPSLDRDYYFKLYGKRIVNKYRDQALDKFGKAHFRQENNYGAPIPVADNRRVAGMPVFWEFVQFVLATPPNSMDEHWRPAHLYCNVCSFKLDAVLQTERLTLEEPLLRQYLGVDGLLSDPERRANTNTNEKKLGQEELTQLYFSELSDQDVRGLADIYRMDFLMFNYTFTFDSVAIP